MTQAIAPNPPADPPRPSQRYTARQLSGVLHWGIYDNHLADWCSLAVGTCYLPLEWKTRGEAETWLYLCRVAWMRDLVPAPEGWNTLRY